MTSENWLFFLLIPLVLMIIYLFLVNPFYLYKRTEVVNWRDKGNEPEKKLEL